MPGKRDIDRKRDGAFKIKICDPDDKSPIRLGFSDSKNFYSIKDNSIHAIKLLIILTLSAPIYIFLILIKKFSNMDLEMTL